MKTRFWRTLLKVAFMAAAVIVLAGAFNAENQRVLHEELLHRAQHIAPLSGPALRIMTFNIRVQTEEDGDHDWPHRRDLVAGVLRFNQIDIACLQEAYRDMIDDVSLRMPGFAWYGLGTADGKASGSINPIFWRTSRFELLDACTFWLSETPEIPGRGWDAVFPRAATQVRLREIGSGRELTIFNVHLDNEGAVARSQSARLLARRARKVDGAVIVLGDFNSTECEPPCEILKSAGLRSARDASLTAHFGLSTSFNDFRQKWPANYTIDQVLVSTDLVVQQEGIPGQLFDGKHASDHFPVLVELAH